MVADSRDAVAQAEFWAAALGWNVRRRDPEWSTIGNTAGSPPFIGFAPVPETTTAKNRLHLDLLPAHGVGRAAERARLEALGARLVETIWEDGLIAHEIMADPEGNEFCLLEPYDAYYSGQLASES